VGSNKENTAGNIERKTQLTSKDNAALQNSGGKDVGRGRKKKK